MIAKPISDRRLQSLEDRFCQTPIGTGFAKFCDEMGLPESERIYLAEHLDLRYIPDGEKRDAITLLISVAKGLTITCAGNWTMSGQDSKLRLNCSKMRRKEQKGLKSSSRNYSG